MKTLIKNLIILSLVVSFFTNTIYAQTNTNQDDPLEVKITKIIEEKQIETLEGKQLYQKIEAIVEKGSLKEQKIIFENGNIPLSNIEKYKKGDKLLIIHSKNYENQDIFLISDYIRRGSLFWLFFIFIIIAIIVGKKWAISSFIGLGFSFFIIIKFILPQIIQGSNPIIIAIIGASLIIPVTFYLSHGFNKKTHISIISTIIALITTGILSHIFIESTKLTGFASEETTFLQVAQNGIINIKGLLLAGIIIGTVGVLDDITISQAAIVQQLHKTDPTLHFKKLYFRAMQIGQDHISSMINTLILVYTGASLPLLLLFTNNTIPFSEAINYELIAEEIIRALVGSIGLILAVPITTFLSCFYNIKTKN